MCARPIGKNHDQHKLRLKDFDNYFCLREDDNVFVHFRASYSLRSTSVAVFWTGTEKCMICIEPKINILLFIILDFVCPVKATSQQNFARSYK